MFWRYYFYCKNINDYIQDLMSESKTTQNEISFFSFQ